MYHEFLWVWKELLQQGFREDGWPWDWTTLGVQGLNPKQRIRAKVVAKSEGIWAAESLVGSVRAFFPEVEVVCRVKDGGTLQTGTSVVEFEGSPRDLFVLERPFLNLAAYVSGVATLTNRLVREVGRACPNQPPRVTLTRKTLPGYRDVAILGVRIGGGYPHRVNLAGGVLIKENHIAAAGGIERAIRGAREVAPHGLKIEVEVRNLSELQEALAAEADGILLDNFSSADVQKSVQMIQGGGHRPVIEVSGGLSEGNISQYSIRGVDVLSVGALTHSVKSIDLSILVYA